MQYYQQFLISYNEIVMMTIGAEYIGQLLKVSHTLQKLYINNNDIGDDGIKVISEALQYNKSLTTLMIEKCGISAKGSYS